MKTIDLTNSTFENEAVFTKALLQAFEEGLIGGDVLECRCLVNSMTILLASEFCRYVNGRYFIGPYSFLLRVPLKQC